MNNFSLTRISKVVIQTLFSLILGLTVSLSYLQEDQWFKNIIENKINHALTQVIKAPFTCKIKNMNLIAGEVSLDYLTSSTQDWKVQIPMTVLKFSYKTIFFKNKCELSIIFHNIQATSLADENEIPLVSAIKSILNAPSSLPITCVSCELRQAYLTLINKRTPETKVSLICSSENFVHKKNFKSRTIIHDGYVSNDNKNYAQKISGNIFVNLSLVTSKIDLANLQTTFDSPVLAKHREICSLIGNYNNGIGSCEFSNFNKSILLQLKDIFFDKESLHATLSFNSKLQNLNSLIYLPIDGACSINGKINLKNKFLNYYGTGKITDINKIGVCSAVDKNSYIDFDFVGDEKNINGKASLQDDKIPLRCLWTSDFKEVQARITQTKSINFINNLDCTINGKTNLIKGKYSCTSKINNKINKISGSFDLKDSILNISGYLNNRSFNSRVNTKLNKIEKIFYKTEKSAELISLFDKNNKLTGVVKESLIKELIADFMGYDLKSMGDLDLKISNIFLSPKIEFNFKKSAIRLPQTYNIIKDISGIININLDQNILFLDNLLINLHKGKINSSQVTISKSKDRNWYLHAPISFSECLISLKKDFIGIFSGMCVINYDPERSSYLKGNIVMENSFLKGNIFSSQVQKDIVGSVLNQNKKDINLDLAIQSKDPLKVKTTFLEAESGIDINIKGTLSKPEISGNIDILNGKFSFPYKSLYISQGKIILSPDQDPIFDIMAKNTIKKYGIKMHVYGTTKQPQINFESSPPLQKEQIITLLLAGSEEGSVFLVMPQVVMQAFETLLFGSEENYSKMQRSFKSFLKPLKYVRIIPNISGKEIKGGIEISFNDKLRASIQNKLDLSDETQMKLEYALSDDINIRGIKDEQGNISGEVEMRWKF